MPHSLVRRHSYIKICLEGQIQKQFTPLSLKRGELSGRGRAVRENDLFSLHLNHRKNGLPVQSKQVSKQKNIHVLSVWLAFYFQA